ncbi:hypothetical protein KIPB_004476, partial [Kipferlia bialata]|eukprot:g4476.t1
MTTSGTLYTGPKGSNTQDIFDVLSRSAARTGRRL